MADNAAPARTIGSPDEPIRVIAFSSGGFDTAMDLGVIHALLVMQGKAPDASVGISAGAVNAVALAEVLQREAPRGGLTPEPEDQQRAQVARFREILEAFANAPAELAAAYLPDTLQIEAGRSLEPLRLPIHNQREREGRDDELHARQGFIRLFNFVLRTRLSFATLTRFIRRYLGVKAAGQIRSRSARGTIYFFEVVRSWTLIGANLHRIAELMLEVVWRPLFRPARRSQGATAARVLFARRWFRKLRTMAGRTMAFVIITSLWLTLTAIPIALLWLLGTSVARLALNYQLGVAALVFLLLSAGGLHFHRVGVWRQLTVTSRHPGGTLIGELILESFEMAGLLAIYCGIPLLLLADAFMLIFGESFWRALQHGAADLLPLVPVVGLTPLLLIVVFLLRTKGEYRRRFLGQFDLADGLLSGHPLKDMFVRIFDPEYYGPRVMTDVVDRALQSLDQPTDTSPTRKLLRDYEGPQQQTPIAVGLVVANVGTGELEVVDGGISVVDGLYAATAVTPFLPPAVASGKLYVDGANITSEPTAGALNLLRGRTHPDAPVVHIYSVSPLPFSAPSLREDEKGEAPTFLNLVDVTRRALQLQRFRDASLERRLTELYTSTMSPTRGSQTIGESTYLRAWVTPVEPDQPLEIHQRLFDARTKEAKREAMYEAVAEGCRASLQVMIRATQLPDTGAKLAGSYLPCRTAVARHVQMSATRPLPLLADLDPFNPPANPDQPGLPEICAQCRSRERKPDHTVAIHERHLYFRKWAEVGPAWPHRTAVAKPLLGDPHFLREETLYAERTRQSFENYQAAVAKGTDQQPLWPKEREGESGSERPLVSLLFSGGVFRGVYQLGTLNALSELGLKPDVVAGASVGSITSAMIAQALSFTGGERHRRIAQLAATYLALDRLILTDRFADFVRNLTLRAGATEFSPWEADRFFRRYDGPAPDQFNREARQVIAGLERLFWISPFELHALVRALRLGDTPQVSRQFKDHIQEWLERMGVGREMLGSEPLTLLIAEHVLQSLPGQVGPLDSRAEPFDRFLEQGIYFLATTTNLSAGRLEVLGEQQFAPTGPRPVLLEGLLASSAFPAVFRPRWSWEVMPGSNARHQYIDGGVMDNLPLDAVAHFLRDASDVGLIASRPTVGGRSVPHLLFTASLEQDVKRHQDIASVEKLRSDWLELWRRAGRLRYNKKAELFAATQRTLRAMVALPRPGATFTPIDLEVVTVKPRWLVGTFAFHPMLGFRRDTQAESIAHGCATTLATFTKVRQDPARAQWLEPWGVNIAAIPDAVTYRDGALVPGPGGGPGSCWFRPNIPCPFSRQSLATLPAPGLPAATVRELDGIHRACGRATTHQARD